MVWSNGRMMISGGKLKELAIRPTAIPFRPPLISYEDAKD
jgi:hypothetical protein